MIPVGFRGAATPRTPDAIPAAAKIIGCGTDIIQAVIDVETSGSGFLFDGRPKILFERHHFHAATNGKYDVAYPSISNPTPGGYAGGAGEYDRLGVALGLDHTAALESASWGLPQIMGSNHALAGFPDADSMVTQFCASEDGQIDGFASFIVKAGLADELQGDDIAAFARAYNGPDYAVNQYDKRIVCDLAKLRACASASPTQAWPAARQQLGRIQAALNLHGFGPLDPDGWLGPVTSAALEKFQAANNLSRTGIADPATISALLG